MDSSKSSSDPKVRQFHRRRSQDENDAAEASQAQSSHFTERRKFSGSDVTETGSTPTAHAINYTRSRRPSAEGDGRAVRRAAGYVQQSRGQKPSDGNEASESATYGHYATRSDRRETASERSEKADATHSGTARILQTKRQVDSRGPSSRHRDDSTTDQRKEDAARLYPQSEGRENENSSAQTRGKGDKAQSTDQKPPQKDRRQRVVPEKTKASNGRSQATDVYVKIHEVIHDIQRLGDVLTRKVNTPGVELTPTETCIQHSQTFTFCTLTCDSKAMAKKLRNLMLKDKDTFLPRIDCSFRDYCLPTEVAREQVNKAKEDLREKVKRELDNRSSQVLRAHDLKLVEVQEKIDQIMAKTKNQNGRTAGKDREEIAALENKYDELTRQKQEFIKAVDGFHQKLHVLLQRESGYESEVHALRKRLGIECCRLDKALPMYARRQEIVDLVQKNPVSILLAETGSGKSTQVVQYLLDAGLADRGTIACTQPRKVAAVSLATHVSQEMASNVGKDVGYKVGMKCKTSQSTKIIYMTDHVLLNECLTDPDLSAFSCVVVDEAHERSLFTDLLLTMIKRCIKRRPDLKVIVTSATIDPQVFVNFFGGGCPVMKVSGRAFPVDVVWDDSASEENDFDNYVEEAVQKTLDIHLNEPTGDILVFLTSALEIQKSCDMFQEKMKDKPENYKVFPLHGQLQADEQQKVFVPLERNKRKIVFATNCAETSITIDGIKYVVDTGVAKEMRYDAKRNLRCLEVTVISRSSAEQRKGRAGRTASGICYRLYSQRSYNNMEVISLPEILKTHLGHALLKLAELGITPDMYDFVQSPSQYAIDDALKTLRQLGAIRGDVITETGRWIARLPFDPKQGLMTLHGRDCGLLYDAIVLAALVSAGSGLFYRGNTDDDKLKLDRAKLKFSQTGGDSLSALSVYQNWVAVEEKQKNKWCMDNAVNAKAIRGVRETVNEVCRMLKKEAQMEVTYQFSQDPDVADRLRKILFECNASNLCHFLGRERAGYFAALASRQVHFHPSSAICSLASFPEWVVYDQLLQTSRDFITGITVVDDIWVKNVTAESCGIDVEQVRQKKLLSVFNRPAGTHAFFSMVGTRYTRLRELQVKAQALDPSVVVVLEGNQEAREVGVFSTGSAAGVTVVTEELKQTAQTAEGEVKLDVWEVSVGAEESGLRAVLGLGGQVIEILMPHHTRKVYISKATEDITEGEMRQKFGAFGEISYCRQFSPDSKQWGFLIFRKAEEAVAATEGTKDDENDVAQLETRRTVRHDSNLRARLSWNRRRGKGIAYVNISPSYMPQCLRFTHLYIGGNLVTLRLDKKNADTLVITNLPVDITETVIERTILHELGESENADGIIERTSVPRVPVSKTTKDDLELLEKQIKGKIIRHLDKSTVQVRVFMPTTEKTATFKGEATFSDPIEGFQVCKKLKQSHLCLDTGVTVNVEPVISAILKVFQRVYDACQTELDSLISGKLSTMGVVVTVKPPQPRAQQITLEIKASDNEDLVKARTFLHDVVRGDVLECAHVPALAQLLTSAGQQRLQQIEKTTSAYIKVDNRLRTLAIHGSSAATTTAKMLINEYLVELEIGKVEEIVLKGGGRQPGLLKKLLSQYGDELETFRLDSGLHNIEIDYYRHKLKLMGPQDAIDKAKASVEKEDQVLKAAASVNAALDDESVDCDACFCPIDAGQLYRLEACAHPYCKDCIIRQVTIAIKDQKLPVVCSHDGCEVPLAWRDFNTLVRQGHIQISSLAKSAVNAYVRANSDKASFCSTPDCPMVFRLTSEAEAYIFTCPECSVRVCTGCSQQAHDGMTCAMMRSAKQYGEGGVDAWVREDPKRRRACTGCRAPIEKTGGCNKMHCTSCGTFFCWKCGEKFPSESACYDHLTKEHKGIFDLEDVLYHQ